MPNQAILNTVEAVSALYGADCLSREDQADMALYDMVITKQEHDQLMTYYSIYNDDYDYSIPEDPMEKCPQCGGPTDRRGDFCSIACEHAYGECPGCGAPMRHNRYCPDCRE